MKNLYFLQLILIQFLLAFLVSNQVFSQDIIYPLKADRIKCKVLEINTESIKFKKIEQPDGPIRVISMKDVFMIIYEDGTKEVINPIVPELKKNSINTTAKSLDSNKTTVPKKESVVDIDFGFGGGIFRPHNLTVREMYGSAFPSVEMNLTCWIKNSGPRLSIGRAIQEGEPITSSINSTLESSEVTLTTDPISIDYLTRFKKNNNVNKTIYFYFGTGIGINIIHEWGSSTFTYYDENGNKQTQTLTADVKIPVFDYRIIAGFKVKFLYLELKISSNKVDASGGIAGKNSNFGGIWLTTGFRW